MNDSVAIVGGGLAGLAAAVYLARAGRPVTIFERRRALGGRAVTHLRHGYRFNLGPHGVYRGGAAATVYRELGVPVRGGLAPAEGLALFGGATYRLPASALSMAASSLLSPKAKLEAAGLFARLTLIDPKKVAGLTLRQWLDDNVSDPRLRQSVEALVRLTTYSAASDRLSAAVALRQLKIAQRGVVYVHEGWQKLVDALHSHAVTAGVTFVTSSRVVAVRHDGRVTGLELGELELDNRSDTISVALPGSPADRSGTHIPVTSVLLAVDPDEALELLGNAVSFGDLEPVTISTLDVALSRLPDPKKPFALGIDRPHYFSAHSQRAQLTPKGGALLHVGKYRTPGDTPDEPELESLLDQLQPGWREVLVHRRFLPSMTVSHSLSKPDAPRPQAQTAIGGLYLAGDWVGDEGILSDAALASARAAARAILAGA